MSVSFRPDLESEKAEERVLGHPAKAGRGVAGRLVKPIQSKKMTTNLGNQRSAFSKGLASGSKIKFLVYFQMDLTGECRCLEG